ALGGRGARLREAGAVIEPETGESHAAPPAARRVLLAAIALSGFAAMVDEVTWTRLVGLVFGSSVYAFGLMLLLFLAGLALGSAVYVRLRRTDPARVLG